MKTILFAVAAAGLFATPALADAAAQITIAKNHAGMAAKATDITMVLKHHHHAVNCLVGPAGAGFDAAAGNPCGKAGAGAIPETTDAAQKAKLQGVADAAKAGLASTDLATAQKAAQATADAL